MTIREAMKEIRTTQDAERAGKVSDQLRDHGLNYPAQCRMFAIANELDERDGIAEWEELMQEAEVFA